MGEQRTGLRRHRCLAAALAAGMAPCLPAGTRRLASSDLVAVVAEAEHRLAESEAEWQLLRPLMAAPDEAPFASLLRNGGSRMTGAMERLPDGICWPVS